MTNASIGELLTLDIPHSAFLISKALAVEHSSVLNYCMALEGRSAAVSSSTSRSTLELSDAPTDATRCGWSSTQPRSDGYRVTYLPVDRDGLLKLADLENAVTDETAVVSLMWANNETGVLFPVKEIAEFCRSRGVLYHCDAVQAAGKAL